MATDEISPSKQTFEEFFEMLLGQVADDAVREGIRRVIGLLLEERDACVDLIQQL